MCFSCETYALLCGNCHVSKGKLFSLVNGHTAIYVLKSSPLETWQFPHSNAYVSHKKHTRSNHACPSSIRNRSIFLLLQNLMWMLLNDMMHVRAMFCNPINNKYQKLTRVPVKSVPEKFAKAFFRVSNTK